jgi:hypothetical protein
MSGVAPLIIALLACSSNGANATTTAYARANNAAYAQFSTAVAAKNATAKVVKATPTVDSTPTARATTPVSSVVDATATSPAATAVAASSPVGASVRNQATSPALPIFTDPQDRVSFVIPAGWHTEQPQAAGVLAQLIADVPRGNVNISTESVRGGTMLDEYVAATLQQIRQHYPDLQMTPAGLQPAMLGNQSARRYDFISNQQGVRVSITQIIALNGTAAYVLTLTSAEQDAPALIGEAKVLIDTLSFPMSL